VREGGAAGTLLEHIQGGLAFDHIDDQQLIQMSEFFFSQATDNLLENYFVDFGTNVTD